MSQKIVCQLTTVVSIPNIRGWQASFISWDEDAGKGLVAVNFMASGGRIYSGYRLVLTDVRSSKLSRNASATGFDDLLTHEVPAEDGIGGFAGGIVTTNGFTTTFAAWRSATKANRDKALADSLLSLGVVDASLTGTTT